MGPLGYPSRSKTLMRRYRVTPKFACKKYGPQKSLKTMNMGINALVLVIIRPSLGQISTFFNEEHFLSNNV